MPRVNTKTKNSRGKKVTCGKCGMPILPGMKYLKWSFRFGGDRFRCTKPACRPRGSDLTTGRIGEVYSLNERLEDACSALRGSKDFEDFRSEVESIRDDAQSLSEEFQGSRDNLPEQFQDSENGERIGARVEALEEFSNELDSTIDNADWPDDGTGDVQDAGEEEPEKTEVDDRVESLASEFESISCDCD